MCIIKLFDYFRHWLWHVSGEGLHGVVSNESST